MTHPQLPSLPARPADAHKGTFGTVIVVGGSATMIGAPALCASAALRSGVGLVKIATLTSVLPHAIIIEPGATGIVLGEGAESPMHELDTADADGTSVLAVGPGLGKAPVAARWIDAILRQQRATVLDADGLNLLAVSRSPRPAEGPPADRIVLTPHPGEFKRLAEPLGITASATDPTQRSEAAAKLAVAQRAVVVLKGKDSVISDGARVHVNTTGNPALATAGTGDILTGVIASLIAQGMPAYEAAVLGVHLHGLAADLWVQTHSPVGLTARDLAAMIPTAIRHDASSP